jgi:capsular exopolysaccharide synthesis family protein
LIDADLRRPSLHEIAQVPGATGLGDTLKSSADQKLPVYSLSNTLTLVPAGKPDPDPMRALTSSRMQQILAEAATRFDWVLIDAPPIGPIVDTSLLAQNIDAAILVVRADHAHYTDVRRAVESLGRDRIIGVVLNGIDESERAGHQNYAYSLDRTGGVRQA